MSRNFGDLTAEEKKPYLERARIRMKDHYSHTPLPAEIEWNAARIYDAERDLAVLVRPKTLQEAINALSPAEAAVVTSIQQERVREAEAEEAEALRVLKWDRRYLGLAKEVATWSKDPSTQTGAVIVASDNSIVSVGFNGFAKGVKDLPERYADRELKYKMIVHCERNAIIFGDRDRMIGGTLYTWPFMSCSVCAGMVIQAGIARCVAPPTPEHLRERWEADMMIARQQFDETGVELSIVPL